MKKPRKSYMKNHITIDLEYMLIRPKVLKKVHDSIQCL